MSAYVSSIRSMGTVTAMSARTVSQATAARRPGSAISRPPKHPAASTRSTPQPTDSMSHTGNRVADHSRREAQRRRNAELMARLGGPTAAVSRPPATSSRLVASDVTVEASATEVDLSTASAPTSSTPEPGGLRLHEEVSAAIGGASGADEEEEEPTILSPMAIRFNRYDTNRDGVLDKAEVRALLQSLGVEEQRAGGVTEFVQHFGTFGEVHPHQFSALWAAAQQLAPAGPTPGATTGVRELAPQGGSDRNGDAGNWQGMVAHDEGSHESRWAKAKAKLAAAEKDHATAAAGLVEGGNGRGGLAAAQKLLWAAETGDRQTAEQLLADGVRVDATVPSRFTGASHLTPLMQAARHDRSDLVRLLLQHGADVHSRSYGLGEQQWTALHHAAQFASAETVTAILRGGADPGAVTMSGKTAADLAAESGNAVASKLLLTAITTEHSGHSDRTAAGGAVRGKIATSGSHGNRAVVVDWETQAAGKAVRLQPTHRARLRDNNSGTARAGPAAHSVRSLDAKAGAASFDRVRERAARQLRQAQMRQDMQRAIGQQQGGNATSNIGSVHLSEAVPLRVPPPGTIRMRALTGTVTQHAVDAVTAATPASAVSGNHSHHHSPVATPQMGGSASLAKVENTDGSAIDYLRTSTSAGNVDSVTKPAIMTPRVLPSDVAAFRSHRAGQTSTSPSVREESSTSFMIADNITSAALERQAVHAQSLALEKARSRAELSALLRSTSPSAPGDAPVLLLPKKVLDSTPRSAAANASMKMRERRLRLVQSATTAAAPHIAVAGLA